MKRLLGFFLIVLLNSCVATAQQYKSHTVSRGETLESIAKQYDVSTQDILKLNPDIKRSVRRNNVLIIPTKSVKATEQPSVTFTNHKVRRKETLFSISQKYGIEIDDILKFNEKVAKEGLKKGDRIAIPKFNKKAVAVSDEKEKEEEKEETLKNEIYIVKAKETKWGIAHSYGMTIEELEDLNPEIKDGLKIGQEIKLPIKNVKPEVASTEKYAFYTVKPKQTVFTLTRKLGVSEDELIHLNPALKDGLKAGMILKLPVEKTETMEVVDAVIVDKFSFLENADPENVSNIVFMLPFKLNEINTDSISKTKEKLQKDRLLGFATDFYSGSLIALDSIKKLGFSSNVTVLDTEGKVAKTTRLVSENDFSDVHAVIGPIRPDNVAAAAKVLKSDGVPVISPLSKKEVKYNNVYQSIPSDETKREKMLDFLKEHGEDKNIIIIADKDQNAIKSKLKSIFSNAGEIIPEKGNYIKPEVVLPLLKEDQENWVILESTDGSLIANVTSVINSYNDEKHKITLLTTYKSSQYENDNVVTNNYLANLNFHYPTIAKPSSLENSFVKKYEEIYGTTPSKAATRGFDVTYDILLRLAYDQNLAKSVRQGGETNYVENKFDYSKKIFGGFFNKGVYIVKYEGLEIKEVK